MNINEAVKLAKEGKMLHSEKCGLFCFKEGSGVYFSNAKPPHNLKAWNTVNTYEILAEDWEVKQ